MNLKKNMFVIAFVVVVLLVLGALFTGVVLAAQYVLDDDARLQGAKATLIAVGCVIPFVGIVTWMVVKASK